MTNEVTLLPCPFCGRSDTTRYGRSSEFHEDCDGGDGGNEDYFAVFCDASEPRGLGGCGASGGFAKTHEEAAERWNRRRAPEPSVTPGWIKCSDRMPEFSRGVLVYGMGRNQSGYQIGVESLDHAWGWSGETGIEPEYWMPLPSPPNRSVTPEENS